MLATKAPRAAPRPGQAARARLPTGGPARRRLAVRAAAGKWDYIIVGGGTAGCVLANRLSAGGDKQVLVLEAGGNGGDLTSVVPAGLTRLFQHPTLDWNLFSARQQQLSDREVYLARGKTLGGSSATNATLYLRGSPTDYDAWGLPGWGSADVLPWFVSAETNSKGASRYHGAGGAMRVESPRYSNELHGAFFASAAAAGLSANDDFNAWDRPQAGFGEFQVSQQNGRRADSFATHLKPALGRPNLRVITGARTTRLATEGGAAGPRAVGVEYAVGGPGGARESAELAPGGELLLCGGTVANPQLLMLSGIGPAAALAASGVPLVADAPGVGQNLQDHPATLWAALMKPELEHVAITSQLLNPDGSIKLGNYPSYLLFGRGPLATTGCDRGAFVNTRGDGGEPDLQVRFVPGFALDADAIQSYIKFGKLKETKAKWPAGVTMQLLTARPKSRGTVALKSTDPFDLPKVELNYFQDDGSDLATLVAGVKLARRIAAEGPLASYLAEEGWPGAGVTSEADLEAYVRRTACSGNALTGTCRMGASPADGSVVSAADFTAWGVAGLRVVDASVVPTIPGGQTGAVTFMLAERAAALLTAGTPIAAGGAAPAAAPALV
ncbi:alkJ [Scenedesmus sp. PABB004]|nr:alkJ [Scenedesmus sp. PABB004]